MPDLFDDVGIPQNDTTGAAPLSPLDLGLPPSFAQALGPSPQLPSPPSMPSAPPQVAQDPKQRLAMLATLGFMLGSGQHSGLAQGAASGTLNAQGQLQQQANARFAQQKAEAEQQQRELLAQQAKAATDERLRQQTLMTALGTIKKQVGTLSTKAQYDTEIDGYAAMLQKAGYRLDANWLRQAAPFVAPKASTLADKALKGFLSNPANKTLLEQHPEELSKIVLTFDRDGDGVPEQVPLLQAAQIAGTPFATDASGHLMTYPKGTTLDDKANADGYFADYLAQAKAEGKDITDPKVRNPLRDKALAKVKEFSATQGGGATGGLTDEGLDYAATQYRVTGVVPALGQGSRSARTAIVNKAAEQARGLGQTPAAAIQKQAAYKADAESLKKIRSMSAAAESFESKALQQADLIDELSRNVPRTKYPILNDAILSGRTRIEGDEAATLLLNAITTFSAEYAKIMEGSTGSAAGSSDASRAASAKLISAAMNQRTFESVVNLMKREMRFTIQGYDATVDHITTRMGGSGPAPEQKDATGAVDPALQQAADILRKRGTSGR